MGSTLPHRPVRQARPQHPAAPRGHRGQPATPDVQRPRRSHEQSDPLADENRSRVPQRDRPHRPGAIGDFSISYWGGYQILGDNLGDNIDAGIGAEQDILFGWESEVAENVTLATTLALYFYPLAKEEIAGTAFPFYLEPSAVVTYSTAVDLKLGLFYYYGIQSALEIDRYLYVNPGIEKSIELGETLGLDLAGAFGLKVPTGDAAKDAYDGNNSQDAVVSAALPWSFGEGMSLAPKLSFAWTNIKDADFADSYMTYGGLDFEWEL
jgi:hypothetical protein